MGFIGVRVQRFKDEGVSGFACLTKVFGVLDSMVYCSRVE